MQRLVNKVPNRGAPRPCQMRINVPFGEGLAALIVTVIMSVIAGMLGVHFRDWAMNAAR